MRVHQPVAHGGPVIEAMIETAGARLLLVVARDQRRRKGRDLRFDRGPFGPAVLILGGTRLQTALVFVGTRIADVLLTARFRKEQPQADTARRVGPRRIEASRACNR